MTLRLSPLLKCSRGSGSAEFAMVLPLLLLLLFGIVDVGRYMWEVNRAEKATQVGARMAVVTTPVSPGLVDADFASDDLAAGELIPATALGSLTCTASACSCTGNCSAVTGGTVDTTAFNALVARMDDIKPDIAPENVEVTYRGSGFGFAGNPIAGGGGGGGAVETMEISPLVTVSLTGMQFTPITFVLFGGSIDMPSFSTTLTSEDASGLFSN